MIDVREFSTASKMAFSAADQLAMEFGHLEVDTPHLLYGIRRVNDGVCSKILDQLMLTQEKLKEAILHRFPKGPGRVLVGGKMPYTEQLREVIAKSVHFVNKDGGSVVEPTHLLLALLDQPNGPVKGILESCGVSVAALREAIGS